MYIINSKQTQFTLKTDLLDDCCCNIGLDGYYYDSNPTANQIIKSFPSIKLVNNDTYITSNECWPGYENDKTYYSSVVVKALKQMLKESI